MNCSHEKKLVVGKWSDTPIKERATNTHMCRIYKHDSLIVPQVSTSWTLGDLDGAWNWYHVCCEFCKCCGRPTTIKQCRCFSSSNGNTISIFSHKKYYLDFDRFSCSSCIGDEFLRDAWALSKVGKTAIPVLGAFVKLSQRYLKIRVRPPPRVIKISILSFWYFPN